VGWLALKPNECKCQTVDWSRQPGGIRPSARRRVASRAWKCYFNLIGFSRLNVADSVGRQHPAVNGHLGLGNPGITAQLDLEGRATELAGNLGLVPMAGQLGLNQQAGCQ
jgi:hypothetical protein